MATRGAGGRALLYAYIGSLTSKLSSEPSSQHEHLRAARVDYEQLLVHYEFSYEQYEPLLIIYYQLRATAPLPTSIIKDAGEIPMETLTAAVWGE